MAKTEIKLNSSGIRSFLRSDEMRQLLDAHASNILGRLPPGYEKSAHRGPGRYNVSVIAAEPAAKRDCMENDTLLKAVGRR